MYHGEVKVSVSDLDDFLVIAKDLKVEGLTMDEEQTEAIKGEDNCVVVTEHKVPVKLLLICLFCKEQKHRT